MTAASLRNFLVHQEKMRPASAQQYRPKVRCSEGPLFRRLGLGFVGLGLAISSTAGVIGLSSHIGWVTRK